MLIKKELATIPLLPIPEIPKSEKRSYYYAANAQVCELKKSGRILVVDFYRVNDHALQVRFFSDGKGYQCTKEWPVETWSKCNPKNKVGYCSNCYSDPELDNLVESVIGKQRKWSSGILSLVDDFVSDLNYEERAKKQGAQEELRKQHFAMFPKLPEDLTDYCDAQMFHSSYLFFTQKDKEGRRRVRCGVCGHEFEPNQEIQHNFHGRCPSCGRTAVYKAIWIKKLCMDEGRICIAERVNGDLLIRWMHLTRTFEWPKFEKRYLYSDTAYNLHLSSKKGVTSYDYYMNNWGWHRGKNGNICSQTSLVYTGNLRETFGAAFHGVDMQKVIHPHDELRFGVLLRNLEKFPETEYLLKLGLTSLANTAELLHTENKASKPTFASVLGISKQLLPMYQEMNVKYDEHRIIKAYGQWVSSEEMEAYRLLRPQRCSTDTVIGVLKTMSFTKFLNYFHKQKLESPDRGVEELVTKYRDYIEMSNALNIDLTHKSVRFPKDIVLAHDRLLPRFNTVKDAALDAAFAKAVAPIYEHLVIPESRSKNYCIVLPQVRSDLVREGQSLNHCVGTQERYYKNHMAGTKLIFFVRQTAKCEKPFVTMEVDMSTFCILQIYGYGDKAPEMEVRKFAEGFVKEMGKQNRKIRRKTA